MTPFKVALYPSSWLSQKCEPVPTKDIGSKKIKDMVVRMMVTMMRAGGCGLAANQICILKQVIVLNTAGFKGAMINPVLLPDDEPAASVSDFEGCLSFPGEPMRCIRKSHITVGFWAVEGDIYVVKKFTGFTARAVQHEIEHLEGKTMRNNHE